MPHMDLNFSRRGVECTANTTKVGSSITAVENPFELMVTHAAPQTSKNNAVLNDNSYNSQNTNQSNNLQKKLKQQKKGTF